MDTFHIGSHIRVEDHILGRERHREHRSLHVNQFLIALVLDLGVVPSVGSRTDIFTGSVKHIVAVCLGKAVPGGSSLREKLVDATVHVIVGAADEIVPAVSLKGEFKAALLPNVIECDSLERLSVGALTAQSEYDIFLRSPSVPFTVRVE